MNQPKRRRSQRYMKKRIKIKWKNIIIVVITFFLIIFTLIKGTTFIFKTITTKINQHIETQERNKKKKQEQENKEKEELEKKKKEEQEKKEKEEAERKKQEQEKNKKKKQEQEKDENYKKLGYINKEIDYFYDEYLDRYLKYKEKNPNLSNKQIIIDVNIGLDYPYYENTKKTKHLNQNYILVNKYNYLEKDYIPQKLEKISTNYAQSGMKLVHEAKIAFEKMAKDAKKEGYTIIAMSTYRSYNYQVNLYNRYVRKDGKKAADTYSGRPGHSEHQTGYAVDVYNGKYDYTEFEKTKEFKWMQQNAHKYGFILRFPKNKEKETGYKYESWHYRYVGEKIAKEIHNNNSTLEEYHAIHKIK